MTNEEYMSLALTLSKKGEGYVNPNPMVGAVIVKNGKIIGQGYHEKYGELHAERNAILDCKENPKDATMYVTLEPCCHYGKTPPCTEAIIESGITKVFVGCLDPNPVVSGKGVEILKNAGIEVHTAIFEAECMEQNSIFMHYIKTKQPFVTMKYAMTLDGKIATASGESKWITDELARENVHKDRNRHTGIMVGVGTVIMDDPMLTSRISNGRNPVRIICDTNLRTPLNKKVVTSAKEVRTIIGTACQDSNKHLPYLEAGCEIVTVSTKGSHLDLQELMTKLGAMKIDSILLEGGSTLNFSALENRIVNKVQAYIAPKIYGGDSAKTPVGGSGIDKIADCVKLKDQRISYFGKDILIESEVEYPCLQAL